MNTNEKNAADGPDCLRRLVSVSFQLRSQFDSMERMPVTFERVRGVLYEGEKWAVRRCGFCLSADGEEWIREPMPSSRNEVFFDQFRFDSLEEAVAAYDLANVERSREGTSEPTE